jgi:hypothetical protein
MCLFQVDLYMLVVKGWACSLYAPEWPVEALGVL